MILELDDEGIATLFGDVTLVLTPELYLVPRQRVGRAKIRHSFGDRMTFCWKFFSCLRLLSKSMTAVKLLGLR